MNNFVVVRLKTYRPSCQSSLGVFEIAEPLKAMVVGEYFEVSSLEVGPKFLYAPDNSEALALGSRVISLGLERVLLP